MAGIIWLSSYPKSGNTWLRVFLHNYMTNAQVPYDINRLDDLVLSGSARGWYDRAHGDATYDLDDSQLLSLRPGAQAALANSRSDDVFVKTHSKMARQKGIDLLSPSLSAGAIYIVRNPLDVVVSSADHFGVSIDKMICSMADPGFRTRSDRLHVSEYIGNWSTHVDGWTAVPDRKLLILRYEDLLENPYKQFLGLCAFLGLPEPRRPRLERAIRFSSFNSLQMQEVAEGFKERAPHAKAFFRSGKSNAWRNKLSRQQMEQICNEHGKIMQRFDYLPITERHQMNNIKERIDHA